MKFEKTEMWKDIKGYEGLYKISSKGKVFSIRRNKNIKPYKVSNGYLAIELNNGKPKKFLIHRLVALEFIENKLNKKEVNHIDGDKLNNDVSNLEWCSSKENSIHAIKNNLQKLNGEYNGNSKLKEIDVLYIRNNYKPYDKKYGIKPLSKKYNVSRTTISCIVRNLIWNGGNI